MKLRVNRHELGEALAAVSGVTASRTPKPILQCVLMEAQGDCCVLKATDLEISVRFTVTQVEVEEKGDILVSAEKLSQIVRESGDEILSLETGEGLCHVRGQDSHFQIYQQDAREFPPVASADGPADFELETGELRRLVGWTAFAAARETSRYAINGVLWELQKGHLSLTATDGRRLSHAEGKPKTATERSIRAIIPIKALNLFMRIVGEAEGDVGIRVTENENQVVLRSSRATVISALVEGQFPNYRDVIPTDSDKKADLNTAEFLSAIRRAALLTNDESRSVKLSFQGDELILTGRAPEEGEAVVRMLAAFQGEPVDIGFNPVFLVDALKVVESDRVTLDLKASNRPGILRCGPDMLYVVMPLNLS
jgi:DNA polymerase-3 subunit beta